MPSGADGSTVSGVLYRPSLLKSQDKKVEAVGAFPRAKTQKKICTFLGLAGYYQQFVPNFFLIASPLSNPDRLFHAFHTGCLPQSAAIFLATLLEVLKGHRPPWSKGEKRCFSTTIVLDSQEACNREAGLLIPISCPPQDAGRAYNGRISNRKVSDTLYVHFKLPLSLCPFKRTLPRSSHHRPAAIVAEPGTVAPPLHAAAPPPADLKWACSWTFHRAPSLHLNTWLHNFFHI